MTKAVNPFGPDADEPQTVDVRDAPDWQTRRDRAVWYAVVGVGLMFAGRISTALAVGGAMMALFGIVEYIRWTLRRPKNEDPWRDEDIDAWEEQHYGEGDGLDEPMEADAPDMGDSNPDEAWGVHNKRF